MLSLGLMVSILWQINIAIIICHIDKLRCEEKKKQLLEVIQLVSGKNNSGNKASQMEVHSLF